jgi:4'-phosphopantetheinyl transferase
MLALPSGQVNLWWARPRLEPGWINLLDDAEQDRLSRFHRPEDAARFLTGAMMVRCVFAADLEIPAEQVQLDRICPDCHRPHGKVRLVSRRHDAVQVSVSHSNSWVVVAATRGASIGVDVERVDTNLDHLALGRLVLRNEELLELASVDEHDRAAWFTTCWVRKEAVVKAMGLGLRVPLRHFAVSGPSAAAPIVEGPSRADWHERVRLVDLECDDAYGAALAVMDAPLTRVLAQGIESLQAVAVQ